MKKTYTDYLNGLSGNRMDIFEELISSKKYKKFRKFYKIVSKRSSDIAYISYLFSESDSLEVEITVNPDVKASEFIEDISKEIDDRYDVDISYQTKVVFISISSKS